MDSTFWIDVSTVMADGNEVDVRSVRKLLHEAMASAQTALDRGSSVLVHCMRGWHRAGLFIICLLVVHSSSKHYAHARV